MREKIGLRMPFFCTWHASVRVFFLFLLRHCFAIGTHPARPGRMTIIIVIDCTTVRIRFHVSPTLCRNTRGSAPG